MKTLLRHHGPWIAVALAVSLCARFLWPSLVEEIATARQTSLSLASAPPDSAVLRHRVAALAADSVRLARLKTSLDARVYSAADPGAQAVEEVLDLLSPLPLGIERVQPSVEGDRVRIHLSGSADLGSVHKAMERLEQGPRQVRVRTLSLRKADTRLQFDLELVHFRRSLP